MAKSKGQKGVMPLEKMVHWQKPLMGESKDRRKTLIDMEILLWASLSIVNGRGLVVPTKG